MNPFTAALKRRTRKARKKAARAAARPVKKAGRRVKAKAKRQLLKGAMNLFAGYRDSNTTDPSQLDEVPDLLDEDQDDEPGQRDGFDPLDRLDPLGEWDRKRSLR